jgi:hypothetical protein
VTGEKAVDELDTRFIFASCGMQLKIMSKSLQLLFHGKMPKAGRHKQF